ncbi:branched-chain amino acid ABC transporter permease [Caldinitratiruptor microaerophilus]|uniref:Branched-chain amino acid ABC transporter permease n=1 Tax=Caldinitratiruptor microaerophilus TaxID=671077 RepID=A0AA35CKH2_9FIRM|nr:branched-chain amino acid ABC transporter permease [Caldinitratiruptor microaerophilus]BDG60088.1 branched-chain amino acid ABC transporter permease [Caldinitratiruptor microaerophilus]
MTAGEFLNLLVAALLLAGIYATMSFGMTVIYGVMKIINLAHAGFMMLGAYFAYELYQRLGVDPILGSVLAIPVFFVLGVACYFLLVRWVPTSDQPTLPSLLLLFGLWLVLQNVGYSVWGNTDRSILTPFTLSTIRIGPVSISTLRAVVFAVAVLSLVVLQLVLTRTWFGRSVRALTQNKLAGQIVGIDTQRTAALTFGLGIAFAGMAGALLATLYSFNPDFGRPFLLRSFVIIVLGGLESFSGVAVGALILALVETFTILVVPAGYQVAISFALLVVALLVLPGGVASLFERRGRAA